MLKATHIIFRDILSGDYHCIPPEQALDWYTENYVGNELLRVRWENGHMSYAKAWFDGINGPCIRIGAGAYGDITVVER